MADKEELEAQRASLRAKLNKLHDLITPVEAEYRRLTKDYETLWKNYIAIDTRLAKLDGRHKRYSASATGNPQKKMARKEPDLGAIVKQLTPAQIVELIQNLENKKG